MEWKGKGHNPAFNDAPSKVMRRIQTGTGTSLPSGTNAFSLKTVEKFLHLKLWLMTNFQGSFFDSTINIV